MSERFDCRGDHRVVNGQCERCGAVEAIPVSPWESLLRELPNLVCRVVEQSNYISREEYGTGTGRQMRVCLKPLPCPDHVA